MRDRLGPWLLPPLLLLGLLLREGAGPARPTSEASAAEATPFLDPESAWFARRVELALSAGRLPQADRFLSHPHATAVAEPPLFPAVLGWSAAWLLGDAAGGAGQAPDERRLERLLALAGPLFGTLLVLAAYAAGRRSGAGASAGLLAAAALALSGAMVSLGAAGRLSLEHWAALLACLQFGPCRAAWGARESLDRLQGALFAGLMTGLGLASTPLFAAPALAAWAALLVACYSAPEAEVGDRARAGLLFSISAILPAQIASIDGPWQAAPPGPVAEWVRLSIGLLIAGSAAFALPLVRPLRRARSRRTALVAVAVACAGLALAVVSPSVPLELARPLRSALGRAPWNAPAELQVARDGVATLFALLPWLVLVALPLAARRLWSSPEGVYLGVSCSLAAAAALLHPPAAVLALVPAVLGADAWLSGAWRTELGPARAGLRRVGIALAGVALLQGLLRDAVLLRSQEVTHGEARELVRAMRWLREHSDPSGAWNAAGAGQDWGVLCEGAIAGLVPYHARRPALGTSPRASGDPGGQAESTGVLALEDEAALVAGAAALGARYLLLRSTPASDAAVGPAARRLAQDGALAPPGARRVYPLEGEGDADSSEPDRIAIYELDRRR